MSSIRLSRAALLRNSAVAFANAFTTSKPPAQIVADHFIPSAPSQSPRITEHGPAWAQSRLPFLGTTFTGEKQCLRYFELLGQVLAFEPREDTFPSEDGFVVDEDAVAVSSGAAEQRSEASSASGDFDGGRRGVVTVVAKGRFRSVKTGRSWEERFTYHLSGFDEQGRIGHWEIWADPLSAWVAVGDEKDGRDEQ